MLLPALGHDPQVPAHENIQAARHLFGQRHQGQHRPARRLGSLLAPAQQLPVVHADAGGQPLPGETGPLFQQGQAASGDEADLDDIIGRFEAVVAEEATVSAKLEAVLQRLRSLA